MVKWNYYDNNILKIKIMEYNMDNNIGSDNNTGMAKGVNTLMNTHDKLISRVNQLRDLEVLSNRLLEKFNRTENMDDKSGLLEQKVPEPSIRNIVDLFDVISEQLDEITNNIGSNIERVAQMID